MRLFEKVLIFWCILLTEQELPVRMIVSKETMSSGVGTSPFSILKLVHLSPFLQKTPEKRQSRFILGAVLSGSVTETLKLMIAIYLSWPPLVQFYLTPQMVYKMNCLTSVAVLLRSYSANLPLFFTSSAQLSVIGLIRTAQSLTTTIESWATSQKRQSHQTQTQSSEGRSPGQRVLPLCLSFALSCQFTTLYGQSFRTELKYTAREITKEPEDYRELVTLAFRVSSFSSWTKQIFDFWTINIEFYFYYYSSPIKQRNKIGQLCSSGKIYDQTPKNYSQVLHFFPGHTFHFTLKSTKNLQLEIQTCVRNHKKRRRKIK